MLFRSEEVYEVGTTQGRFDYFDEQEMINPLVVDTGLKGLGEKFVNDMTIKVVAELNKGKQVVNYTAANPGFDQFVDATAVFGEQPNGLFAFVSPVMPTVLNPTWLSSDVADIKHNIVAEERLETFYPLPQLELEKIISSANCTTCTLDA